MPFDASSSFAAQAMKLFDAKPFYWLLEARVASNPDQAIRLVAGSRLVTFGTDSSGNPISYYPGKFVPGDVTTDSEGNLPSFTISVGNVAREVIALLILYDYLEDAEVVLRVVHKSLLNDPSASVALKFALTKTEVVGSDVVFTLSGERFYEIPFPDEVITSDDCRFAYRGVRCGYTGDPGNTLGDCLKTPAECQERRDLDKADQYTRFGAFRGVARV